MRKFVHVMAALAFTALSATGAFADACEEAHDPAPASDISAGINLYNETSYAFRVFWIDGDGFLSDYGVVQPGEVGRYDSFVGHQWLVEIYAPDRTECFGPISPRDAESCEARILWEDGAGIDAGFCDFPG